MKCSLLKNAKDYGFLQTKCISCQYAVNTKNLCQDFMEVIAQSTEYLRPVNTKFEQFRAQEIKKIVPG